MPEVSSFAPLPTDGALVSVTDAGIVLRPMLPYSVIPGGAQDASELRDAIAHDPVVAMHYAVFDLPKTHVVRLDHTEAMYVSYRLGNRVYWTSRKLMIHKGETLLSDGQHLARTRCGNQLSPTSESPTTMKEPERAALETPLPPELEAIAAPPAELPLSPIGPLAVPPPAPGNTPGSGGIVVPPIIPVFWGAGPPGKHGTTVVPPPPPPPPPPPAIPEPSTLLLLGAGLSAVGFARRKLAGR